MSDLGRTLNLFLASFVFLFVIICSLEITQVDIWWQLVEGQRLLHHWHLPTQPAAAFGLPARPYFDEYAGYEVVLAVLYRIAGFGGIWFLFIAVYLLIMFLPMLGVAKKQPAFSLLSTLAFLLAGILLRGRLEQRPELIGVLLLVLLFLILRPAQLASFSRRDYGWLFVIFAVWSNTHSTFIIGLFALGLWLGCEMIFKSGEMEISTLLRPAVLVAGTAVLATLVNPYGPRRLLFPFWQASDPGSTALSVEMWPLSDFHSVFGMMILSAGGLLVIAFATSRRPPVWLLLFSIFAFVLALKSTRFISLLSVALLFVYSARAAQNPMPARAWPWPVAFLKNLFLALLCTCMLFEDSFDLLFTYNELRQQTPFPTNAGRFAPTVVAAANEGPGPIPVLCGHGEGSYLTFAGGGKLQPLLDSGMAHFSDASKRYFFFAWDQPEAFAFALDHLHVEKVVLDRDTVPWIIVLRHAAGWKWATCSPAGMLWTRDDGPPQPLTPPQIRQIEAARDAQIAHGRTLDAFFFDTMLDQPVRSLTILSQYSGLEWSDSTFAFFLSWVDELPEAAIKEFMEGNHAGDYPLVDAALRARLDPAAFVEDRQSLPAEGARSWQWQLIEVRACLAAGDRKRAQTIFAAISPPISSASYRLIRKEVGAGGPAPLNAYDQWQTWDDSARAFMAATTAALNERIEKMDGPPAR